MPIAVARSPVEKAEKASHVLSVGIHQFLSLCTNPSLRELTTEIKGDAAFEYIHRIVLATTAPAATLLISLLLTERLLKAMRERDDAMLKGFFYENELERVSQKVLAIWSVAIIVADANMNDNAFAATSWAQVTVFKEARVVGAWKRWAGDLMNWDFDVKEDMWKAFLATGSLKNLCDLNPTFRAQAMLVQKAQAEKDLAVIAELSQTQLHHTWTIAYSEQVKLQQQKIMDEQQQQQQQQLLLQQQQQQQQKQQLQYSPVQMYTSTTPTYSPVFQPRVSSIQTRRSLPVLPHAQLQYNALPHRYSTPSTDFGSNTLPPIAPQPQSQRSSYYQYPQQQQQLHSRASMPRLSTAFHQQQLPQPISGYTTPTSLYSSNSSEPQQSRLNSYSSIYEGSIAGTMTPSSASSCATPGSVRLSSPIVEEVSSFDWSNGAGVGAGQNGSDYQGGADLSSLLNSSAVGRRDNVSTAGTGLGLSARKLAATLGRPQSYESFRESSIPVPVRQQQFTNTIYQQPGYSIQPQQQQQQQYQQQQQQGWAIPSSSSSTPTSVTTTTSSSNRRSTSNLSAISAVVAKEDELSTSLSSMQLGETPPAASWLSSTPTTKSTQHEFQQQQLPQQNYSQYNQHTTNNGYEITWSTPQSQQQTATFSSSTPSTKQSTDSISTSFLADRISRVHQQTPKVVQSISNSWQKYACPSTVAGSSSIGNGHQKGLIVGSPSKHQLQQHQNSNPWKSLSSSATLESNNAVPLCRCVKAYQQCPGCVRSTVGDVVGLGRPTSGSSTSRFGFSTKDAYDGASGNGVVGGFASLKRSSGAVGGVSGKVGGWMSGRVWGSVASSGVGH
ncbi:UNVERIFIED_CONTAM: hypothetical protein HDU68_007956 [Siphonaria sp. JEL0065]|nr:hypothetical protein HDU68_007956 [Siphonaria sp. JEL0065]